MGYLKAISIVLGLIILSSVGEVYSHYKNSIFQEKLLESGYSLEIGTCNDGKGTTVYAPSYNDTSCLTRPFLQMPGVKTGSEHVRQIAEEVGVVIR